MPRWLSKLTRFGLVGGIVTTINFLLYVVLISLGVHYLVATTLGWVLGLVIAFFGNKHWTFGRRTSASAPEGTRFLLVYVAQLAVGSCTLVLMIDHLGLDPRIAFVTNVPITATFSYLCLNRFVFRAHGLPESAVRQELAG